MVETIVLTGTGGLLGVGFGLMCGPLFRGLRHLIAISSPDMLHRSPCRLNRASPSGAIVLSLGVGVIFGVSPARKAAFLDPIEALRHL
jgi:putative ABC transport system permease protein